MVLPRLFVGDSAALGIRELLGNQAIVRIQHNAGHSVNKEPSTSMSRRIWTLSAMILATLVPTLASFCAAQVANLSLQQAATLAASQNPATTPGTSAGPGTNAPLTLTFQDALQRAHNYSVQFQASVTELGLAREDRVQARAAMLPTVIETTQYLYTQGTHGIEPTVGIFVANNGVHEYVAQGNAHEIVSLAGVADFRRSGAMLAVARARAEIARRGLVVTVAQSYYGLIIAQRKYATAQQAASEAQRFFNISKQLEQGGEVAHSDTVKAEIQFQQQQQALQEAQLAMSKARLDLAVLLFPNFNQDFSVVDDLNQPQALPAFPEVQALATRNNPDLRAAAAALRAADQEVASAWDGYLPALTLDYWYGVDANHFAVHDPRGFRNLGYAAEASLVLPVWNWGATRSKVHQAGLRRQQAQRELSLAQRGLVANLLNAYNEATTARAELQRLARAANLAAESRRLTTLRYQSGEATVLEVVDAQNTLNLARNAYDDAQSRYRVAIANLQILTGSF
jgi:outer membrane protein TolC